MSDLISRQAAIDAVQNRHMMLNKEKVLLINDLEKLPSAEPKKGRWISADAMFHGVPFYCSECGENTRDTVMGKPRWKFCPNCGAKMEVTT